MNRKQEIDTLWAMLADFCATAYADNKDSETGYALRDYVRNQTWTDARAKLLGKETAHERQHRSSRPSPRNFSNQTAAKLLLLDNIVDGSELVEMPSALTFITLRDTAAEANLLGFMIRDVVTPEFRARVKAMDYAKIMHEAY